jgi:hypothetical protein
MQWFAVFVGIAVLKQASGGVEGPFEVDHSIMRGALEEVTP